MNYDAMTEAELEAELEQLGKEAEEQGRIEAEREAESIKKFEQHVVNTMCMGAKDRATALRWIMSASNADGDWEYFCFLNGLPYGYFQDEHQVYFGA